MVIKPTLWKPFEGSFKSWWGIHSKSPWGKTQILCLRGLLSNTVCGPQTSWGKQHCLTVNYKYINEIVQSILSIPSEGVQWMLSILGSISHVMYHRRRSGSWNPTLRGLIWLTYGCKPWKTSGNAELHCVIRVDKWPCVCVCVCARAHLLTHELTGSRLHIANACMCSLTNVISVLGSITVSKLTAHTPPTSRACMHVDITHMHELPRARSPMYKNQRERLSGEKAVSGQTLDIWKQ